MTVSDLPTARASYITVRAAADRVAILLATPGPAGAIESTLASAPDLQTALVEAERIGSGLDLPVKPEGAQ
ncbi:MAG: hypothetical protein NXI12_02865 [Alphaproteobacteria bacterium]|nr:hypothetical protein [Alphaproteobacteria bacterium]